MRELTREEIDAFLDEQVVGRMGCQGAGLPYVVPLIYARRGDALYALTTEGRKTRSARESRTVCFEVDDYERATGNWTSAIVWGRYEELHGERLEEAVAVLAARHGQRRNTSSRAPAPSQRPVIAFRIVIETATGRQMLRTSRES